MGVVSQASTGLFLVPTKWQHSMNLNGYMGRAAAVAGEAGTLYLWGRTSTGTPEAHISVFHFVRKSSILRFCRP